MKPLDWFVLAVTGTAAYLLLSRLAGSGAAAGRTYYAAPRVIDYSAPGRTDFVAPPSGFVWDETRGAYVQRGDDGAVVAMYV